MRRADCFCAFILCNMAVMFLLLAHAAARAEREKPVRAACAWLVRELQLTDLALFTDARYSRHPSQADLHSPFQDHPLGLDHFPSGSLIAPPPSWQGVPGVREMHISGEIAKARQGYIIRGKVPAEVFTILNPCPDVLAPFLGEGKITEIDVRIVSGDNVEIERIGGKEYPQTCQ